MNKKDLIERRDVLSAVGTGLGYTAITGIGAADAPDLITVPKFKSFDGRVIEEMEMSEDWLHYSRQASRAKKRLVQRLRKDGVNDARVGITESEKNGLKIRVEMEKRFSTQENPSPQTDIPDKVDNIPVEVKKNKKYTNTSCANREEYDSIPSGVGVKGEEKNHIGTTGWKINYKVDGETYPCILTAAHVFNPDNPCDGISKGSDVYQNGNRIGRVVAYNLSEDWAIIYPDKSGKSVEQTIQIPNGERREIGGFVTKEWLQNNWNDEPTCYKIGISSGLQKGSIFWTEIEGAKCRDFGGEGVETKVTNIEGDSGGPVFVVGSDSKFYIVHMTSQGREFVDAHKFCGKEDLAVREAKESIGTPAFKIHE